MILTKVLISNFNKRGIYSAFDVSKWYNLLKISLCLISKKRISYPRKRNTACLGDYLYLNSLFHPISFSIHR